MNRHDRHGYPSNLETAGLIYLRDQVEAVYMPAAAYFAQRPKSPHLVTYLDGLGDLRSEPLLSRIMFAKQNWPLIPEILRGAARLLGESTLERIDRINLQLSASGLPVLTGE